MKTLCQDFRNIAFILRNTHGSAAIDSIIVQKLEGAAWADLIWDIIPPLLMLSCLGRCVNAVHAYYNYCPSYTSRITSWDLLPQMTGRLAAREELASRVVPPLQQLARVWKCLQQLLFFHVDVAKMGTFSLSAGLEYLPSGIPPSASAAPTAPTTRHIGPSLCH